MIISVINGPNLNMLGARESHIYGSTTLEQIKEELETLAAEMELQKIDFYQSNSEGEIVDKIQSLLQEKVDGILINPGAYGHTSIAIRDALLSVRLPFVEVHLSNIYAREEFRHRTLLSDIAAGVVLGFGPDSYLLGLRGLHRFLLNAS